MTYVVAASLLAMLASPNAIALVHEIRCTSAPDVVLTNTDASGWILQEGNKTYYMKPRGGGGPHCPTWFGKFTDLDGNTDPAIPYTAFEIQLDYLPNQQTHHCPPSTLDLTYPDGRTADLPLTCAFSR